MKAFFALPLFFLATTANILNLPPDMDFSVNPVLNSFLHDLHDTPFWRELAAATNNSAPCTSPSYSWTYSEAAAMGFDIYNFFVDYRVIDMPFIYKMLIDKNEDGEYFGADGSHTEEMLRRQNMTETFWDAANAQDSISTDQVVLLGAHGDILKDYNKIVPTVMLLYPLLNAVQVDNFVSYIQYILENRSDGYDNPLLTANALAFRGGDAFGTGQIFPKVIVIGDGIIERMVKFGLGDSGPDFIHAHEFAHQLQFELGVFDDGALPSPEDTRNKELMADAFSAYFLAHDEGANMTAHEILELHATAFSIGDCSFDSDGHHGTPAQRRCASMWGASQALVTGGQKIIWGGRKLQNLNLIDPIMLRELFESNLDNILSLDSKVCPVVRDDVEFSCGANQTLIVINIQLDQHAVETSWALKGETYKTLESKEYSAADSFQPVTELVCIYPDDVYVFDIFDFYGDGIIGGYFKIFNGTNTQGANALLVEGDGGFGRGTSVTFSLSKVIDLVNNTSDANSTITQNTTNTTEPEITPTQNTTNTTAPTQNTTNTTEPEIVNSTSTTSSSSTSVTTTVTVSDSTTTTIIDPDTSVVTKTTVTVSNSTSTTTTAV